MNYNLPIGSTGAALACLHALYEALVLLLLVLQVLLVLLLVLLVLLLVLLVLLLLLQVEPLYGDLRPRGQPYSLLDGHVGDKPEQSNLSRHVELDRDVFHQAFNTSWKKLMPDFFSFSVPSLWLSHLNQ